MKYFIDTNLIIDVFERKNSDSITKLSLILEDSNNEIFYNGIVYTETLRTILDENTFSELKSAFDLFTWLDIDQSIYTETKKFSRFCHSKEIKVTKGRCEVIDIIHFITAKHYGLELFSNDSDMQKLEEAYQQFFIPSTHLS
ncbi:MAG: PIN domain-containing protein [Campylobacterales bacterium]|nr:PIN domain-containing protein [Campylobacterales bacterium]